MMSKMMPPLVGAFEEFPEAPSSSAGSVTECTAHALGISLSAAAILLGTKKAARISSGRRRIVISKVEKREAVGNEEIRSRAKSPVPAKRRRKDNPREEQSVGGSNETNEREGECLFSCE